GVVVTRPAHQAEPLCRALTALGARVTRFPTIAIAPPADGQALTPALQRLDGAAWAVFVSPNAVHALMRRLHEHGLSWPPGLQTAAVGPGTAAALREHGVSVTCVPASGADAAALLAEPGFQPAAGERVVLVKGEGGRAVLGEGLAARGIDGTELAVYRRVKPDTDPAVLDAARSGGALDVAVVTSVEALENLVAMAGPDRRGYVVDMGLVAMSRRVADRGSELGFGDGIVIPSGTGPQALAEAVTRWAADNRRTNKP
ncbi:MAG: uroporphyrinogen-III synthase, partial [Ectothiorhodospiraceae bacterium]